jgi:molybdenum-dependent DNA-binding transcriptional regulator ModE
MGKSKKRGGEKAHNKRVAARNNKLLNLFKTAQKKAWEKFEDWKKENESKNNGSI